MDLGSIPATGRGSSPLGRTSSEIPNTAPFPALRKTALCWEFLRLRTGFAPLDSGPRGTRGRLMGVGVPLRSISVSRFAENCALLGISSPSDRIRSAGFRPEGGRGGALMGEGGPFSRRECPVILRADFCVALMRKGAFHSVGCLVGADLCVRPSPFLLIKCAAGHSRKRYPYSDWCY